MLDVDSGIREEMIGMHTVNPDADYEKHYGWENIIDYDADDIENSW